jgi:GTP diphosphokinase / guanosine-3',5'-bis(diphosphate) 3'-diphosphatase
MTKIRLNDIVDKVLSYHANADTELIESAYIFSAKHHKGQTRFSGEPYLAHPLAVSMILAEMHLDSISVATGLLHDTVEDTLANLEEINNMFGKEIASLVDGLTKISKLVYTTREERQAESFRKMIVYSAEDVRVPLIKLADRLHNMRTLEFHRPERKKDIAQETLDIYAPLANRLGIGWIKSELEDLSFKYISPRTYEELERNVEASAIAQAETIEQTTRILREMIDKAKITGEVIGRLKHLYSIHQKLQRQRTTVDQVFDLIGFRIKVDTVPDCYTVLGLIHNRWRPIPGRFKDFIGNPKVNGYQSLHTTIIGPYKERVEIQIRTHEMHSIAEDGVAAHWRYKEGSDREGDEIKNIDWLRKLVELQQDVPDNKEFMASLSEDLKSEEVFVLTPQGEAKQFPLGSTPIDFAYSIHTDIGDHCHGAKVNGRIVPLSYRLKTGDSLHILTHPQSHPSKDWLGYVATPRARSKIRGYLNKEMAERAISLGRDILEKGLRKYQLNFSKLIKKGVLKQAALELKLKDNDQLFKAVSSGKIDVSQVAVAIDPTIQTSVPRAPKKTSKPKASRSAVVVQGIADIMVRYAHCCNPLRGDDIVGYITKGHGITVHRSDCIKLNDLDQQRIIETRWDDSIAEQLSARLRILCQNNPGMLADISREISIHAANIVEATFRPTRDNLSLGMLSVLANDSGQLQKILESLRLIDGVISAERVMR